MAITTAIQATGRAKIMVVPRRLPRRRARTSPAAPRRGTRRTTSSSRPYNDLAGDAAADREHATSSPPSWSSRCSVRAAASPPTPEFLAALFDAARARRRGLHRRRGDDVAPRSLAGWLAPARRRRPTSPPSASTSAAASRSARSVARPSCSTSSTPRPAGPASSATPARSTTTSPPWRPGASCSARSSPRTWPRRTRHAARRSAANVAAVLGRSPLPVSVTGYGSMMTMPRARPCRRPTRPRRCDRDDVLQELIFLGLYERGVYTAPRGMINVEPAAHRRPAGRGSRCARRRARRAGGHAGALGELGREVEDREELRVAGEARDAGDPFPGGREDHDPVGAERLAGDSCT